MDCEYIKENLPAFIDGELEEDAIVRVESHLAECEGCRSELEDLRRTARMIEDFLEPRAMDESVADGVMANIASQERRLRVPLMTRLGWALTGAAAAVLVLVVLGIFGNTSGTQVIADEVLDSAVADHARTFELFKKQAVNSAVRDPEKAVGMLRMEIKFSGLEEKTSQLIKMLAVSRHPRKNEFNKYIASVHEFLAFVEEPPLKDLSVTREALEKKAIELSPIEVNFAKGQGPEPFQVSIDIPEDLDETTRRFVLAKRDLYSGNFGSAAKAFSIVARQVPGNPIAEDAKYWMVYSGLQGGSAEINMGEDVVIPNHMPLRREIGKDVIRWVEHRHSQVKGDTRRIMRMVEMIGKKVGVIIETSIDEDGRSVIKVEQKGGGSFIKVEQGSNSGNETSGMLKIKCQSGDKNQKKEEEEERNNRP